MLTISYKNIMCVGTIKYYSRAQLILIYRKKKETLLYALHFIILFYIGTHHMKKYTYAS